MNRRERDLAEKKSENFKKVRNGAAWRYRGWSLYRWRTGCANYYACRLNSGEQYRLVFVTSTTTNALSSDINYYNNFVNDLANLNPVLASLGTTWTAIASTETVNARANTATHPVANGAGAPIYLLDGSTKIADSNADLWSGTLDAPIDLYEDGTSPISAFLTVWTGTIQTGLSFPIGV